LTNCNLSWASEIEHYSNLFKSAEEITQEIEAIKDILFSFNIENAEEFSRQLSQIQDRATVLALEKGTGRCAQPLQPDSPARANTACCSSWISTSSASSTAKPAITSTCST
jgi:hypothetical protein